MRDPSVRKQMESVLLDAEMRNLQSSAGNANNNYVLTFPPSATPEQKARARDACDAIGRHAY